MSSTDLVFNSILEKIGKNRTKNQLLGKKFSFPKVRPIPYKNLQVQDEEKEVGGSVTLTQEKIPRAKELLSYIETKKTRNLDLEKKLELYSNVNEVMESGYSYAWDVSNIIEDTRKISVGKKKVTLHVVYPSTEEFRKELDMKSTFYGNSNKKEIMDLFEEYVRKGVKTAFDVYKNMQMHIQKITSQYSGMKLEQRIEGHLLVRSTDLQGIKNKEINSEKDIIPEHIYLVPNKSIGEYSGLAFHTGMGNVALNIRTIFRDAIFYPGEALTAAHEFVHQAYYKPTRLFEHEHSTHIIDLFSRSKGAFLQEFLTHKYSELTDILEIAGLYFDPGIREAGFDTLKEKGFKIETWNKKLLRDKKFLERVDRLREPCLELMLNAEAEYASENRFALDTLIRLTGMPTFPLWLKAAQLYEPKLKTAKTEKFLSENENILQNIVEDTKEEYFSIGTEIMESTDFYFGLEPNIRDFFDSVLENTFPKITKDQKLVAWDYFIESFLREDGKIAYEETRLDQVYHSTRQTANLLHYLLQHYSHSVHCRDDAKSLLKELAVLDYVSERSRLATSFAEIEAVEYELAKNYTVAEKIVKFRPEILNPSTDLFKLYKFPLWLKAAQLYEPKLKTTKTSKISAIDLRNNKKRNLKLKEYSLKNSKLVQVFRGYEKKGHVSYEKKPSALLFGFGGAEKINTIVFDSNPFKDKAGHNVFDMALKFERPLDYIPFELLFDENYDDFYSEGVRLYTKPKIGENKKR